MTTEEIEGLLHSERCGMKPHPTSPPRHPEAFADFCARMVRRYT